MKGGSGVGVYGYMERKETKHDLDPENKSMWNETGMQPAD